MSPPAVSLERVSVTLGSSSALTRIDLSIDPGSSVALTGSNGSGKSTLLAVIAGIQQPTSGRMQRLPGRVAWVAQRSRVPDGLPVTVQDVVTMGRWGGRPWRPLTRSDRFIVGASIGALGLHGLEKRPLAELSGGQRQRAFVAQGLAQRAGLLLLDEPTVGLDDEARELIESALAAEAARGVTVIHATHDSAVAERADRVVRLEAGELAGVPSTP